MSARALWAGGWTPDLADRDALILVPPFGELHYPALGVHVLQACAGAAGHRVGALYANLLFASAFGGDRYRNVAVAFRGSFLGERLFARAAYGGPPLGDNAELMFEHERLFGSKAAAEVYSDADHDVAGLIADARRMEAAVPDWVEAVADHVAALGVPIVGATTTFEQTAPAVALLKAIKRRAPQTTVILGGANCEGEMAEGMTHIAPFVDHIFSGECEEAFPAFMNRRAQGDSAIERIIRGKPCERMDAIPALDYDDYFGQRAAFLGDPAEMGEAPSLSYETSRGCWWGQKHHCTFCGLNGAGMGFRIKSPDKVIAELRDLTRRYGVGDVMMSDNIMPHTYFNTLIPRLPEELPGVSIFYEQKANLSLDKLLALKAAGVHMIQPGIEALSTDLLKLMRKGVSARQNLNLLRQSRSVGISVIWNLLWGFAGEDIRSYEETLALVGSITHLQPPGGFWPVMIDRFSPYFTEPEQFGITDVRPLPGYADFLPPGAPVDHLAYHFMGSAPCASQDAPELMRRIQQAVADWRARWSGGTPPELRIGEHAGLFVLIDTRGLAGNKPIQVLDADEARRLLTAERFQDNDRQLEMLERRLAVHLDGWLQPLPIVDPSVLALLAATAPETQWAHEQTRAEKLDLLAG